MYTMHNPKTLMLMPVAGPIPCGRRYGYNGTRLTMVKAGDTPWWPPRKKAGVARKVFTH